MSFAAVTGVWANWWLANRNGGVATGTFGSALVSDLLAADYVVGARTTVVSTGTTTSGVRTLTLSRPGYPNFVVGWRTADTVHIIRP
jgi:hypothetical protein